MNLEFFDKHSQDYAKLLAQFESNDKSKLGVIFVENIDDSLFWQEIATHHTTKLYSNEGKNITGKSKLLEICNPNQLIAIDSDFDNLCPNHRSESILFSEKKDYILQTYTHGLENILFSPDCLHEIFNRKFKLHIKNDLNPTLDIFEKLSEILFEPYQKFLFLKDRKIKYISDKQWIDKIKFKGKDTKNIVMENDFSHYQERITLIDNELGLKIDNQADFESFCDELSNKGFSPKTTWAFIRCHDFEQQFAMPIIKKICSQRIKKEMIFIESNYSENEISNRKSECNNHFKTFNGIETVLHHYFYDVYFQTAKHSHLFLNKIIQDYNKIINA